MRDEDQNDYMDEEEELKTPLFLEKKKKKKKQIESETENNDEGETMDIRVKQISEKPDRVPPIVAYFSSGYNPCAETQESDDRESPRVTVYRHKVSKKRLQVVVSPPGASVEFVGSSYMGEQLARQTCVYKLGVLDKESKTLRILPIAQDKIIRLEPRVKIKEAVDSEASADEDAADLSVKDKTKLLNIAFGTKKAINRDKKRHALNPGDDPDAQKFLDGKLNEVDVNTGALESTNSIIARNIPPYDASATTPREVYPIGKIIENGEWDFLQDVYRLSQQENAATDAYPVFVRNRLYKLRDIKDENEKQTVAGVLTFLTHLVKFKDIHSMNGMDSAKDHRFPGIIRQKCKSLFKDPESDKIIPADKINLLISYVLVLTLHVDKFKTDPADISKDLRMSKIDLRSHFEDLGCKFSTENKVVLATLKVPLTFPQIRRKRRR